MKHLSIKVLSIAAVFMLPSLAAKPDWKVSIAAVGAVKVNFSSTFHVTIKDAKGAPVDHVIPVREVRLSAGAEFVVAICGEIMTMPGLPRVPAADSIDVGADGRITGLF